MKLDIQEEAHNKGNKGKVGKDEQLEFDMASDRKSMEC